MSAHAAPSRPAGRHRAGGREVGAVTVRLPDPPAPGERRRPIPALGDAVDPWPGHPMFPILYDRYYRIGDHRD